MKDKSTTSKYVPISGSPLTLEAVFTSFEIPGRLQKKKIRIPDFDGLTKEEIKGRLEMVFLQEGEVRLEPYVWYQVYGNMRRLYVCFFSEDNRCGETYFFKGWIMYAAFGRVKSFISKIKRRILFGIGKFILWVLGKGGQDLDTTAPNSVLPH